MKNKFISLLFKEKLIILTGLILGLTAFLLYFKLLYIPMYSSSAELFIRNVPRNNVVLQSQSQTSIQSESGFSNPLFNLSNLMSSQKLSSRVYKEIQTKYSDDLKKMKITSEDDWNSKFKDIIKTKILPSSDIINISFTWVNKNTAKDLFNEIITQYKKTNIDIRKTVETQQRKYLDSQVAEIGNKLNKVRAEIKDYRMKYKAIDLPNESIELTRARVDLEKEAQVLKSDISYYNKKLKDLSSQLGFANAKTALRASAIGEDPYLVKLNQDLSIAQQNYSKLQAKFKDNYPEVIAVKNEIQRIQDNIAGRQKESLGNVTVNRGIYDIPSQEAVSELSKVQSEKNSTGSKLAALKGGIGTLMNKEAQLPAKFLGLEDLEKQEAALLTAYTNIKQAQLEARIKENQIVDNIVTLSAPSKGSFMMNNLLMKLIGFIAFGVMGAVGLAWVKDELKGEWENFREIEETTGKKVLGVIPWINSAEFKAKSIIQSPETLIGTAYRNITSNIIAKSYLQEAQAISFISTVPTQRASSAVTNIAATMAKLDKSIVVIDTDPKRSGKFLKSIGKTAQAQKDIFDAITEINVHYRLNKSVDNEFVASLMKETLIPVTIETKGAKDVGFYYLCGNKKDYNVYDYIASRGFGIIVDFLKQHNEFILIETPPRPIIFPEVREMTRISDSSIIVSALETNKDELTDIISRLNESNAQIMGIITREENSELEEHFKVNEMNIIQKQRV